MKKIPQRMCIVTHNKTDKKDLLRIVKDKASGETSLYINSNRQIPQNTKDAYNIYLKYDFGEDINKPIKR